MLSSSQKIKQFKSELEAAKKLNTITLYHNMYATPPTKNSLHPEFFFHRFPGHNQKKALYVYRLIVVTLIGNFFDYPFLN